MPRRWPELGPAKGIAPIAVGILERQEAREDGEQDDERDPPDADPEEDPELLRSPHLGLDVENCSRRAAGEQRRRALQAVSLPWLAGSGRAQARAILGSRTV